jgi:hypothetical protein
MIIKREFSGLLVKSFAVFFLIFYSLIPILEIFTNRVYWGGSDLDLFPRMKASLLVIFFLILFMIGFKLNLSKFIYLKSFNKISLNLKKNDMLFFLLIIFSCFICILYFYNFSLSNIIMFDLENFFIYSYIGPNLLFNSKIFFLFLIFFFKPLIFNLGLYVFFLRGPYNFLGTLGLFIGIFSVFVTSVPRFLSAALYLPIILHYFFISHQINYNNQNLKNFFIPCFLIIGIFFIFPILDLPRIYDSNIKDAESFYSFLNNYSYKRILLDGHFDSYQIFTRGLDVGEINFGFGFLSSLLFFIPRSMWIDKGSASCVQIAEFSGLNHTNISCPIILELYLNFWYLGVLFGGFFLGFLIARIDNFFTKQTAYKISISWIIYFQSIPFLFLFLRGSFISAFAYFVAWIISWLVIIQLHFLIRRFIFK